MSVSVLVHGVVLALLALLALVLSGMSSDSRVAAEVALSYWIFWGLQAVLSSALFPWLRKSPLRYGLGGGATGAVFRPALPWKVPGWPLGPSGPKSGPLIGLGIRDAPEGPPGALGGLLVRSGADKNHSRFSYLSL